MPTVDLELSHRRTRAVVRLDQGAPLPSSDESAPLNDPLTGRFVRGNRGHRRRQLRARAEGIATLDPSTVPSWLRPHVEAGRSYVVALLDLLEGKPALHPLAGDAADAHAVYRAMLGLAFVEVDPKVRAALLAEARGWLREHRTSLATLSALAGDLKLPEPNPHETLARALQETAT